MYLYFLLQLCSVVYSHFSSCSHGGTVESLYHDKKQILVVWAPSPGEKQVRETESA